MTRQLLLITTLFLFVFDLHAQQNGNTRTAVNAYGSMTEVSQIFEEQELMKKMKAEGLTDNVIDKLLEERKRIVEQGGRKVKWISYTPTDVNKVYANSCSDMGVENGWGNWQAATGTNSGGNPGTIGTPTVPVAPQFNITTGTGIDPCTPGATPGSPSLPVTAPGFGSSSIQLGQPQMTGCQVEQLTYQLNVGISDTNFIYSYALVFYDPSSGHAPNEAPYAEFIILDINGDTVPCSFQKFISSAIAPGFYAANSTCSGGSSTFYKPWTTANVNLAAYVGQTVTIKITNADCIYCGHYAHSYWDFSCVPNVIDFCTGTPVTICGSMDTNVVSTYQWYQNGASIPGANNPCLTANVNDKDTLKVYSFIPATGCPFVQQYVMLDSCLTEITENNLLQQVNVYPSPAFENIFLNFISSGSGTAQVIVCNILGEEVYQTKLPASGKQVLDVSGYAEGVYFLRIIAESGTATQKILISR